MHLLKKYLSFLPLVLIVLSFNVNAETANPTAGNVSKEQTEAKKLCPCGCACEAPCDCGCGDGKKCECKPKTEEVKAVCPCGCACDTPCECGCTEGKPCECKSEENTKVASDKPSESEVKNRSCCSIKQAPQFVATEVVQVYEVPYKVFEEDCDENSDVYQYDDIVLINSYEQGHRLFDSDVIGIWLPDDAPLFRPFLADPHQITSSAGFRFNDSTFDKTLIDVSYCTEVALYRWENVGITNSFLEIGAEGALWAVFSPFKFSSPLLNADYFIGFPITYAFDNWSFRLRGYHISSHIGDEFLLNHPGFDRRNPSAEYVDFSVSCVIVEDIRLYGVLGYVIHQDESFVGGRVFAEAGAEVRFNGLKFVDPLNNLYGMPFYGMHFRERSEYKHHVDSTYVLGYEWGKTCGIRRCLRTYLEYHDGYSLEGQFSHRATNYLSLRMSYGF